ncbi:arrestin [Phyllosticta citricarpa]|uniref:Arrestin n=1 Tax=Phyllosticta citricarpa TaxID=55181 RepID=A0ABR1MRK4_9PEZI
MLVSILLDQPPPHYTNLDTISGRVLLRATSNTTVSSIIVKLEGESRTRLIPPPRPDYPNKQQRPVLEIHKILYKTAVVFPPPNLQTLDWESHKYTLNVGEYEYPFAFKLPFNNACHTTNSLTGGLNIATLEIARPPTRHVKQTLPPSLTGYPGEAEVKYFVKCTVNRPSLLKENPRSFVHFNFLPIEPPRPQKADGEVYARRQHQFNPKLIPGPERKSSFLGKLKEKSGSAPPSPVASTPPIEPPRFSIDARLPNPAILTLNDDLPLRVLVKQLNERTEPVYLQMFQIELIGYTQVRAHEIMRTESNSWIIASFSNMAIPLGAPSDVPGTEVPINPEYWSDKPLPNTVAPTFETCNLSRYYELEVRVGLGYATYRHGLDQLIVLPLRLPVKVFSGIEPPPALLAAMADPSKAAAAAAGSPNGIPPRKPVPGGMTASPYYAPSSPSPMSAGPANHMMPPQGGYLPPQSAPGYEDAPPSYEDAIATNLPPVNGPRRDYAPPPVPEGAPRFSSDEKR